MKKYLATMFAAFLSVLALFAPVAHAEVPAAVTTAITAAGTDLTTVATAVIVAMVAFWGLRKVGQKLGWW